MGTDEQHRAKMAYVGLERGREVPCNVQGCPAGCEISGTIPLVRMGDRGNHSKTS
ncbi:UNVERIFIED_CONTAM: hypothetical protein Slati_0457900 [Sesamum latifolium]|uniref:Uncharacterized protein n=1 Tax=Sesamum latifolium TaxID=2727402 RepID=A0AAW2XW08_9LAMI